MRARGLPPEDHGVRYISALKFIKAKNGASFGDISCDERDCVEVIAVLHLHLMQPLVDVLHEVKKVYPVLRRDV